MKKIILSLIAALAIPFAAMAQDIEELLPKAQGGDVQAMVELAEAYSNSWDDGSAEKALKWFNKAADAGNGEAMFKLYEAYYQGSYGLDSDEDVAKQWLEKSAAKGYGEAFFTKANSIYYENEAEGMKLMVKAGEAGSANAQMFLATAYNNSWNDNYNPSKAFEWAKKAAEQDLGEAQYLLATFYLKGVGTTANKTEALKWLKKAAENDYSFATEILSWL